MAVVGQEATKKNEKAAPSLQSLFVTPRAVQAMKFVNGIISFVTNLSDPSKLKVLVFHCKIELVLLWGQGDDGCFRMLRGEAGMYIINIMEKRLVCCIHTQT